MAKAVVGSGQVVLLHGYSIGIDLTELAIETRAEPQDVTTLTAAGVRKRQPGLWDGTVELGGLLDDVANQAFDRFKAHVGSDTAQVVTVVPRSDAVGQWAAALDALKTVLAAPVTRVGEIVGLRTGLVTNGQLRWGRILHALTAETATGNSASVDNAASSANGGRAYLHVTAFSGFTNITVKVQQSVDNAVWTDLVTFAAATGVTAESPAAVTGTVNRYLRALWTFTDRKSVV